MIFVMPGSSQVGQQTIEALKAAGLSSGEIVAGVRRPEAFADLPCTVRHADYSDRESLKSAFGGVEALLLIPTKTPPAERCVEMNNAVEAAREAGVKRVVFLSIMTSHPTSVSVIAPFILFTENVVRNSGMEWVILRMGLYMEPVADWVPELVGRGDLPYPVKEGRAAYVTRWDVARALAAAANNPDAAGQIYNVAAPDAVTMPELAEAVSAGCGEKIGFRACTPEEFIDICFQGQEPPFITRVLISLYRAIELGEFDHPGTDVERLTGTPAESVPDYFKRILSPGAK